MRHLIILGAIIAFTIAGCVLVFHGCANACESSGQSDSSQGVSNGASTGSQSAASSVGKSSGVDQSGNGDGNGPSDYMLIDCDNPLFESLLPCKQLSRKANNEM